MRETTSTPPSITVENVRTVVAECLGLEGRRESLDAATPLLGGLPELDSLAVVQLVYALEDRFGITIAEDEMSADLFETLGSLARFIERKRQQVA